MLTMATPIFPQVKDKITIFTARDEDTIFKQKKSWYFISIYK